MRARVVAILAVLFVSIGTGGLAGGIGVAIADDAFHPVPAAPDQGGPLELRVVAFGNGVHGEMEVEVRNPGTAPALFLASGLYFIPDDDGGEAPQRMGVIGAIRAGAEGAPRRGVTVAAGATRRVRFDVYCIDRQRHAPGSSASYTLAPARMPPKLIAALDARTAAYLAGRIGTPDEATAQTIQDRVWSTRRAVRARLAGE